MKHLILLLALASCGHGNEAQHIHHEKHIQKTCYYHEYYMCYGCDYHLPDETLFACEE